MTYTVRISDALAETIAQEYGPEPSAPGQPSEWDFWSGPLAAALIGFRDFDRLLRSEIAEVRQLHLVDPVFGAVVFVGVLVAPNTVEIAGCSVDPDYWDLINDDPIA
ncbi:MAG: hypothetical protein AAGD18_08325 [Actinomycetota bacterium]